MRVALDLVGGRVQCGRSELVYRNDAVLVGVHVGKGLGEGGRIEKGTKPFVLLEAHAHLSAVPDGTEDFILIQRT